MHICYVADIMSSLGDARGCERGKVVKGEFYSRWGSELLPSALASLRPSISLLLSLFLSLLFLLRSLDRLRVTFRGVRREGSGSLRRHQTLYVVTAVIATDYILLWDLLLQRLHTLRGQVVANLHTENARCSKCDLSTAKPRLTLIYMFSPLIRATTAVDPYRSV